MGAIVAVIGHPGDPEPAERLERMLARSPDRGVASRWAGEGVAIGVQSLGWDASLAEHGTLVAAFHGWVGNWGELAVSLGMSKDAKLSDAQRVAAGFERLGTHLFARLRGEFALLLLDRRTRTLVAARDVVGIKPLFFQMNRERTFLASEIRQLVAGSGMGPTLSESFLVDSLVNRFVAREDTLYADIGRLIPGHAYSFGGRRAAAPRREAYWEPPDEERARGRDAFALTEELRFTLDRAVGRALAPRPGAVALSGGMDSTTLWALARRRAGAGDARAAALHAVSMVFPGMRCDESEHIRSVLELAGGEGSQVDAAAVRPYEAIEALRGGVDELFVPSLYHLGILAAAALAQGRDVVDFGLGGDEWLSGTPSYLGDELRRGHVLRVLHDGATLPLGRGLVRLRRFARYALLPRGGLAWRRRGALPAWLHPSRREALLRIDEPAVGPRARGELLATLATHRGANYFGAAEQIAARHQVEVRCPLNDLDVIEFAFRTPGRAFVAGRGPKHLLRLAVQDLVPAGVIARRGRTEFSDPFLRDVVDVARAAHAARWKLAELSIVVPGEVERIRRAIAEGDPTEHESTFTNLWIAERVCRTFGH